MHFEHGQLLRDVPRPLGGERRPGSYDRFHTRYEWMPVAGITGATAFDVERLDNPLPAALVPAGQGSEAFWAAWTRAEALSKLLDVPVLQWIRREPFLVPALDDVIPWPNATRRVCTYTKIWREENLMFTCAWTDRPEAA